MTRYLSAELMAEMQSVHMVNSAIAIMHLKGRKLRSEYSLSYLLSGNVHRPSQTSVKTVLQMGNCPFVSSMGIDPSDHWSRDTYKVKVNTLFVEWVTKYGFDHAYAMFLEHPSSNGALSRCKYEPIEQA